MPGSFFRFGGSGDALIILADGGFGSSSSALIVRFVGHLLQGALEPSDWESLKIVGTTSCLSFRLSDAESVQSLGKK